MKRFPFLSAVLLLAVGTSAPAADLATFQKAYFNSTSRELGEDEQTSTTRRARSRRPR